MSQLIERMCRRCLKQKPLKRAKWRSLKKQSREFICSECLDDIELSVSMLDQCFSVSDEQDA